MSKGHSSPTSSGKIITVITCRAVCPRKPCRMTDKALVLAMPFIRPRKVCYNTLRGQIKGAGSD